MGDPVKMHNGKELSGTTWLGSSEYSVCGWFKVLHFTEKLTDQKQPNAEPEKKDVAESEEKDDVDNVSE